MERSIRIRKYDHSLCFVARYRLIRVKSIKCIYHSIANILLLYRTAREARHVDARIFM